MSAASEALALAKGDAAKTSRKSDKMEVLCAPCGHDDHGKCRDERAMGSGKRGIRCGCRRCWK